MVTPYLTSVPLYGGLWMMACARRRSTRAHMTSLEVDRRIAHAASATCSTTTATCIARRFALPNFVRTLVSGT